MRRHHDGFVIVMTLGPLAVGVWAFFVWHNTGQLPFDISWSQIPAVRLPSVPLSQLQIQLPAPVTNASDWLGAHVWAMLLGTAIGALGGAIVVGTMADIVRGMIHLITRNRHISPFSQPQSSDEIS